MVVSEVSTRLAAAVRAARTVVRRGPLTAAADEPLDGVRRPTALLDPARADFYAARGMRTVCPTQTAISALGAAVRKAAPALERT